MSAHATPSYWEGVALMRLGYGVWDIWGTYVWALGEWLGTRAVRIGMTGYRRVVYRRRALSLPALFGDVGWRMLWRCSVITFGIK